MDSYILMDNYRVCRGTTTVPYPDNCGLPLYNPWPNSDRFFFNGAYWYPKIETMNGVATSWNDRMIFVFVVIIVVLLIALKM